MERRPDCQCLDAHCHMVLEGVEHPCVYNQCMSPSRHAIRVPGITPRLTPEGQKIIDFHYFCDHCAKYARRYAGVNSVQLSDYVGGHLLVGGDWDFDYGLGESNEWSWTEMP